MPTPTEEPDATTTAQPTTPRNATPAYPQTYLIENTDDYHNRFNGCPNAQTYSAFNDDLIGEHVLALSCRRWSCRYCAERRIRQLAVRTREAKPNRLLTLTIDPRLHSSPRDAFDATRRTLPILFAELRRLYGEVEYLRVTELTQNGWPHYHALLRSDYIPHRVVQEIWNRLTGATIVDIRQVKRTFSAYTYLVKYLAKLHKIEWTERHLSYSRKFFPPNPDPHPERFRWLGGRVYRTSPQHYMLQAAEHYEVVQLSDSHWLIPNVEPPDPEHLS